MSNLTLPMFVVDAFSKRPFAGNGAAICPLEFNQVISKDVMQKIAAEMNLSETAFVSLLNEGDTFQTAKRFSLCWFTPTKEVTLCGHATLATAAVLFAVYKNSSKELEFETMSGTLLASKTSDTRISINLPTYESYPVDMEMYGPFVKAVCSLPVQDVVLSTTKKLLVRLQDNVTRQQLEKMKHVSNDILSATPKGCSLLGVIVTVKGSGQADCAGSDGKHYDFMSRYFAPWLGVAEDPVTGSAHSVLGPYWAKVLKKTEYFARQCSSRGGELDLKLQGDRILIGGDAVIVLKGHLCL